MSRYQSLKPKMLSLLMAACLWAVGVEAQDDETFSGQPALPAPNLTVNVTLNSALDDQQTAYYAKLAESLIAKLPRELQAPTPPDASLRGEGGDHLNVVTYLPSLADDPHHTGLDKRIQYFKVRFNFEGSADEAPSATIMGDTPAFVATSAPVVSQTIDVGGLEVATTLQTPEEDAAPAPIMTSTDMIVVGAGKLARDQEAVEETAAKQEQTARAKAAKLAGKQDNLPKPKAEPIPTDKAVPVPPPKTVANAPVKENEVRLVFRADALELNDTERKKLLEFVQKSRATEGVIGYNIVARTNTGPFGELEWLGDERVRLLGGMMRQYGLDVYHGRLNEIHVTTRGEQFIEIEQIRG